MRSVVAVCSVAVLSLGGSVAAQESASGPTGGAPAHTEEALAETQRSRLVRDAVRLAPILANMLTEFVNEDVSREQIENMIEDAIDNLDGRFTGIENHLGNLEARLAGIERNQDLIVTLLRRE